MFGSCKRIISLLPLALLFLPFSQFVVLLLLNIFSAPTEELNTSHVDVALEELVCLNVEALNVDDVLKFCKKIFK